MAATCAWCATRPVPPGRKRYCDEACWAAARMAKHAADCRDYHQRRAPNFAGRPCQAPGCAGCVRYRGRKYCSQACHDAAQRERRKAYDRAYARRPQPGARCRDCPNPPSRRGGKYCAACWPTARARILATGGKAMRAGGRWETDALRKWREREAS